VNIEAVFIQKQNNNQLCLEEQLIAEFAGRLNIPIHYYTKKMIQRRILPLTKNTVVAGDIACVEGAFKQLGVPAPKANSYPKSLNKHLHRNVWHSTIREIELVLMDGLSKPFFAKPRTRLKRFTGRVFKDLSDFYFVNGASKILEVVCSDVVQWVSEFRVYVVSSEIRKIAYCAGDRETLPAMDVIQNAVNELESAGEGYAGYGIDFGVISTGETALIEMNDGYSLGAYGVSSSVYGELIFGRWNEIVQSRN
jgi:hypothetical protein